MGKKAPKASRKLAAKGEIKRQIQNRHKHQKIKKQIDKRKNKKNGTTVAHVENNFEVSNEEEAVNKKDFKGMSVDDILDGNFMNDDEESEGNLSEIFESEGEEEEDDDDDDDGDGDRASFASVDELSDEGEAHIQDLSKLAEKDPEFYKYLQENDKELLKFDPNALDVEESAEMSERTETAPVLTKEILVTWQKAILEHRSIRALRKLLIAFRSASHIHQDAKDQSRLVWRLDNQTVYRKLIITALRYTPVVLDHHIPYKTLPNGKFKQPPTSKKFIGLTKLLLSHFHNILHIIESLPKHPSSQDGSGNDVELVNVALSESAKLLPYIVGSRKAVKVYLKTCLDLWSSAHDSVRITAFLSVRRLIHSTDEGIADLVLKNTYATLVRCSRNTTPHTLPQITMMKNSASELYCAADGKVAYQHAFGYIRQLAALLRAGMKSKTKEAYKQVYNWQYICSIDFWCLVLARACSEETAQATGRESELVPLIYPLVQVSIGAVQLISAGRSYPYHLHIIRSLIHLSKHTKTYIPLFPQIHPILEYSLSPSTSGKTSTLRPLPLETSIRAPAPYLKTRIYAETLCEESTYVLAEWLALPHVQGSIAFPEITIPISIVLKKNIKNSKATKQATSVKTVLERMTEAATSVENARAKVQFAPRDLDKVKDWEYEFRRKVSETPISKIVNVLRKAREKKNKLLEKARDGSEEILEE